MTGPTKSGYLERLKTLEAAAFSLMVAFWFMCAFMAGLSVLAAKKNASLFDEFWISSVVYLAIGVASFVVRKIFRAKIWIRERKLRDGRRFCERCDYEITGVTEEPMEVLPGLFVPSFIHCPECNHEQPS